MDLTMQMKSAELLLNFIKHDTEKIPLYGFMLQKQRFVPKPNTAPAPLNARGRGCAERGCGKLFQGYRGSGG